MNIKSLLIGSAAALAAVSGAQAADAIVAAEPEPLEYVRVCDAFGAGYFYIPGTETCLRIGGEVRATLAFGEDVGGAAVGGPGRSSDWNSQVRARVFFDTKTDSELGTIGTYIRLEGDYRPRDANDSNGLVLEQGYITIGGLKVGKALTFWDDTGINGELDAFGGNANFNTISYTYDAGSFRFGVGIDDLSEEYTSATRNPGSELGLEAFGLVSFGSGDFALRGVYDLETEEGALYATLVANVGPGELNLAAGWSSGETTYVGQSLSKFRTAGQNNYYEWTVSGSYALKATDKLTVTPSLAYWNTHNNNDIWGVGLMAEYQLATGLKVGATVDYRDADVGGDDTSGFLRLTRSF